MTSIRVVLRNMDNMEKANTWAIHLEHKKIELDAEYCMIIDVEIVFI